MYHSVARTAQGHRRVSGAADRRDPPRRPVGRLLAGDRRPRRQGAFDGRVPRARPAASPRSWRAIPSGYQTHLVHAEPGRLVLHRGHGLAARPADADPRPPDLVLHRGPAGHRVRGGLRAPRRPPRGRRGRNANPVGTVSGFAPPGDIHRVTNIGDSVAVSMHVYGTDITRVGSSVRRVYELPVR